MSDFIVHNSGVVNDIGTFLLISAFCSVVCGLTTGGITTTASSGFFSGMGVATDVADFSVIVGATAVAVVVSALVVAVVVVSALVVAVVVVSALVVAGVVVAASIVTAGIVISVVFPSIVTATTKFSILLPVLVLV